MKKGREFQNEPISEPIYIEFTLSKKRYSEPSLYEATEEINGKKVPTAKSGKRWYVWFLWRNPETGNLDIKIKSTRD